MGRYIGHFSNDAVPGRELITSISANADKPFSAIVDIGIQLDSSKRIFLNGKEFFMSKTGFLEFRNVNITKIHVKNENDEDETRIPIIIDYVYIDKEE